MADSMPAPDMEAIKKMMLKTQTHLLVSIWFEVLVYGIAVPFFMAMSYILITKKTQNRMHSLIFGLVNVGLFILTTIHVAFNLYRLVNGYGYMRGPDGTPLSYIQDTVRFDSWGTTVIGSLVPIFAGLLFIYRLFLVWDKNYFVIILPSIIWLWNTGFTSMLLYWFRHQFTTYDKILPWLDSSYPMLFVQNIVVTSLIAFKMWKIHQEEVSLGVKTSTGFTLFNRVFWDSAALYTLHSLLLIPLYFKAQNGQFVLQAGILPGLIICSTIMAIRVHLAGQSTTILADTTDQVPIWLKDEKNSLHSTEKAASRV